MKNRFSELPFDIQRKIYYYVYGYVIQEFSTKSYKWRIISNLSKLSCRPTPISSTDTYLMEDNTVWMILTLQERLIRGCDYYRNDAITVSEDYDMTFEDAIDYLLNNIEGLDYMAIDDMETKVFVDDRPYYIYRIS